MNKVILLFEDDRELGENIAEMLELNGLSVRSYSSGDLTDSFPVAPNSIGICDELTLLLPLTTFIERLSRKVGNIIVFCADIHQNRNKEFDGLSRMQLPFTEEDLINKIREIALKNGEHNDKFLMIW